MTSNGIYITAETFNALEKTSQADILLKVFGATYAAHVLPEQHFSPVPEEEQGAETQDDDDSFVELSPSQAREFLNGCGEKTKKAIDAIASSDSRFFQLADVAKAVGVSASDLRGVWGGLTRRLYTIMGTDDVYLIDWSGHEAIFDENNEYIDHTGELTELTYRSFRKVLKKD